MEVKNRERMLLYLVGALLALFLADRLMITPLWHLWQARNARIAELREDVRDGRALLSRADVLEARWQDMVQRGLPKDRPAAEERMLTSLNRWTRESRVAIKSLKLPWRQSDSGTPRLEVTATAEGSMESIARFLYQLEIDPLATRLVSVEVSTRDNRGSVLTLDAHWSTLRPEDES